MKGDPMHWRKIIAVAVALIGEILFGASLSSSNVFADSAPATAIPAVSCEGSGTTITITIPPPNSNGKLDSTYVAKIVELAGLAPPSCQVEVLKGGLKAVQDAIRTLLGGTLTMKNTAG